MDYIAALEKALRKNNQRVVAGVISGNSVLIGSQYYRITWGGDFDAADGDKAMCIKDGNKCVVMSVTK